jgi:hypothetical protein
MQSFMKSGFWLGILQKDPQNEEKFLSFIVMFFVRNYPACASAMGCRTWPALGVGGSSDIYI